MSPLYNVRDSSPGRSLVSIITVASKIPRGLLWFNNHLLVLFDSTIKQLDPSAKTKSALISKWQVPQSNIRSCIALSKHEAFIAYSAPHTVTLWDTSTQSQLVVRDYPDSVHSIALSPDDRFLAICQGKKINIESLPRIIVGAAPYGL